MRLRNVPGAREVMVENEYVFTEPEGMCGTWKEVFGNDNPVAIWTNEMKEKFSKDSRYLINIITPKRINCCC